MTAGSTTHIFYMTDKFKANTINFTNIVIKHTVKVPNLEQPTISSKLALFRLLIIFLQWNNFFLLWKIQNS